MKPKASILTALTITLFLISSAAFAHHGVSVYDMAKTTTVKATITEFEWTQPHCQIHFDAPNNRGEVQHWEIETPPPTMMLEKEGWTRKSLSPGDLVTIYFHAAKNGSLRGILVRIVTASGQELFNRP